MERLQVWPERFKRFFLNNRFVVTLLIVLLIGINILVFSKVPFIFKPVSTLLHTVAAPLLLSGIAYYLLNPLVDRMETRSKIKRAYGIVILYLAIAGIVTLILLTVIPIIRTQLVGLIDNFPKYSAQIQEEFINLTGSELFGRIQENVGVGTSLDFGDLTNKATTWATSFLNNAVNGVGSFVGALTEIVLAVVTTPFILFYLLRDGKRLPDYLMRFIPNALQPQTRLVMKEMNSQVASYIRGQIIVSCCIGALLYIGYLIIGLEYSLVLAIVAACTAVVPYLGPAIAITPALIVALVTSPFMLLKMIFVWTAVQLIEGKFISPQIMGKSLKIHPITIIFVIIFAGKMFGVLGIILAVPGYAVLKVIVTHIFQWFRFRSGLYRVEAAKEEAEK
ncbi:MULTISPECIES: AI-2E family transporter [unclassified Paenibacillus]|uniref:AI-2E family transporter n=1 Tax=unclassified Paenibacillus TaxID=185978 RepID=UPI0024053809|nr:MULTISPECIES: AI-2E family transporter [unclassified Paenibacillus]MDF9840399.1 putative PurR-regulated permease PerM [Paenibacillus sp. PastF-2]MDF9846981.1 putative PurR-regulated permease PerM [Paenibacillus sp. PastM-2]MDF9853553.1 putative PurR-regulated permease PerM [Paenibacillus sp. PastF-1]MDH6478961.1 putative PurR-regulated permease PerM [Paenibacillus sp. PastH-2]MDH6506693.1 putative PurR-regulated permease PerM [Paenibacillus sp. PastM-3]